MSILGNPALRAWWIRRRKRRMDGADLLLDANGDILTDANGDRLLG